jgi:hypothetical protein
MRENRKEEVKLKFVRTKMKNFGVKFSTGILLVYFNGYPCAVRRP